MDITSFILIMKMIIDTIVARNISDQEQHPYSFNKISALSPSEDGTYDSSNDDRSINSGGRKHSSSSKRNRHFKTTASSSKLHSTSSNYSSKIDETIGKSETTGYQALVFRTKAIRSYDDCRLSRFKSLIQVGREHLEWDVWLLHDQNESEIARSRLNKFFQVKNNNDSNNNNVKKNVNTVNIRGNEVYVFHAKAIDTPKYYKHGLHGGEYKKSKWAFMHWLNNNPKYAHAWYIEDDVVYTGNWYDFFHIMNKGSVGADIVARMKKENRNKWFWARKCTYKGQALFKSSSSSPLPSSNNDIRHNNSNVIVDEVEKLSLTLFRSSRRFAVQLVKEERALSGHHEALFAGICLYHWNSWCKITPLVLPHGSIMTLSGHNLWLHGFGSAYTLRGIASFDPNHNSIDMNKYLNNFEVPKNRVYHPVKCEEELHLQSLTPCFMPTTGIVRNATTTGTGRILSIYVETLLDSKKTNNSTCNHTNKYFKNQHDSSRPITPNINLQNHIYSNISRDSFINGCVRELWMTVPKSNRTTQVSVTATSAKTAVSAYTIAKKNLQIMKYQFCKMCGCDTCSIDRENELLSQS